MRSISHPPSSTPADRHAVKQDLITHLHATLPMLPDEHLTLLTASPAYALTSKDAKTLIALDDGDRLAYYLALVSHLHAAGAPADDPRTGRTAANWLLHDIPAALAPHGCALAPALLPEDTLAAMLAPLLAGTITLPTAKALLARALATVTSNDAPWSPATVATVLDAEGLRLQPLTNAAYTELAARLVADNAGMADKARAEAQRPGAGAGRGKVMWFVGQMVRADSEGRVQPKRAEGAVRAALGL